MTTQVTSNPIVKNYSTPTRHYPIHYGVRDYTFPVADLIAIVTVDEKYIHIELTDGRLFSIPLHWIPPLRDAPLQERQKFTISQDRDAIIWDPEESTVNEILRLSDYLYARCPSVA